MRKDVAHTVVDLLRAGRFADLEALFAPPLRAVVSADTVRVAWEAETARTGPVESVGDPVAEPIPGGFVRLGVSVRGATGALTVVMSVDDDGMLQGLRLAPVGDAAWSPPPYARPRRFTEHDVTIDAGPGPVGATLSLPRRSRRTGVVLLSGGGPFDRDATAGPNKPMKDLAWGLASRGVAVARFDKVTHTRADLLAADGFTTVAEYVPHAVAAIRLLLSTVDRVFVLGHSMGGKVAPRVAAAEPAVAGLILLAAEAQPMHRSAVRVVRHLGAAADAVAAVERQAARVDSAGLSSDTPAHDLPFGLPASYWLELRGYDPVAAAAALRVPMLLLQGGRDYQVTTADDLALWRAGLADRADVTVREFAADDHLFFPGPAPSTPADVGRPQHVDPAVIATIARWIDPPWSARLRMQPRTHVTPFMNRR